MVLCAGGAGVGALPSSKQSEACIMAFFWTQHHVPLALRVSLLVLQTLLCCLWSLLFSHLLALLLRCSAQWFAHVVNFGPLKVLGRDFLLFCSSWPTVCVSFAMLHLASLCVMKLMEMLLTRKVLKLMKLPLTPALSLALLCCVCAFSAQLFCCVHTLFARYVHTLFAQSTWSAVFALSCSSVLYVCCTFVFSLLFCLPRQMLICPCGPGAHWIAKCYAYVGLSRQMLCPCGFGVPWLAKRYAHAGLDHLGDSAAASDMIQTPFA